MSAKIKPGTVVLVDRVILFETDAHNRAYVVLDKAPARAPEWRSADYLYRNGRTAAHYHSQETPYGGGTGQRWWLQDAETGVPLAWAVRESRMTAVAADVADELDLEGVA